MVKVKMFGDSAADAETLAAGFAEALRDWTSANRNIEIVGATTSTVYSYELGVQGIMTVVYRELAQEDPDPFHDA